MKDQVKKTYPGKPGRRPYRQSVLLISLLFLLLSLTFPQPVFAEKMSDGFIHDTQLPAALVTGTLHASELYEKNSKLVLEIPGAARLMTLYLAIERLPADETITISRLVEQYDRQDRAGLDRDVEHLGLLVVEAQQRPGQDQVPGG